MTRPSRGARTPSWPCLAGAALLATALGPLSASAQPAPAPSYRPEPGVRLNTVGYLPDAVKRATVAGVAPTIATFSVHAAESGKVAYSGKLSAARLSPDSGEELRVADFTALKQPGKYVLRVAGVPDSPVFQVERGVYNASLRNVMLGFYGQRCGVAVKLEHNGVVYQKAACHLQDGYLDYYDPARAGQIQEATGGWHDAGDYGKYVVNAAFATGIMLMAWEHYGDTLGHLRLPIPESGAALPDYLAEVKFNLDWLLKMQFPDGRVSHKLTSLRFCPMIMPEADQDKRFFVSWGTDATANLAAVAAQAARIFEPFDGAYAAKCRAAAEQGMAAIRMQWMDVQPDQSAFRTGTYLRSSDSDRRWAALELWETTGKDRAPVERSLVTDNLAVDVDWDWGEGKNLGIYTYLLSKRERDAAVVASVKRDLIAAAERAVENHGRHGYGRGLRRYYWGVNGSLARLSLNLLVAYRLTGDKRYREVALDQLAYLYGRNPYGRSFVTGDGANPPRFPHHRPSAADGIEAPWPGHLVGGGHPTELDWHDVTEDARTNENAINWDASLAYALAAFFDPDAK